MKQIVEKVGYKDAEDDLPSLKQDLSTRDETALKKAVVCKNLHLTMIEGKFLPRLDVKYSLKQTGKR